MHSDDRKLTEEKEACRHIIVELNKFGLTQRQILFLIYLLGLELENIEHMREITMLIKELGAEEVFLSLRKDDDEK